MCELEQELIEFQESSKELEQALEEELQQLEEQNYTLAVQAQTKDAKIIDLNKKVVELTAEINTLTRELDEAKKSHGQVTRKLQQQLVAMEILNEDMVSQDRVLEHKLKLAQQFNNELLEKLALVENDLELERDMNAKYKLTISNLENSTVKKMKMKRDSTYQDLTFADGTILDIDEMLATEPPASTEARNIPRLGSLQMIQELYTKSDVLRTKVCDFSATLKSSTTTETECSPIIANRKETLRSVTNSPSISNLSKLRREVETQQAAQIPQGAVDVSRIISKELESGNLFRHATMNSSKKKLKFRDIMKTVFP